MNLLLVWLLQHYIIAIFPCGLKDNLAHGVGNPVHGKARLQMSEDALTITALSTQACPNCPLCGKPSARIHSHYTRKVADLPMGGQRVRLLSTIKEQTRDKTCSAGTNNPKKVA